MTEEMKAKDATRYLVLELPEMQWMSIPFATEGDARKEAERLARTNPGAEYGIYQKVLTSKASLAVETVGVVG
jgi:hypothetical protein